MIRHLPTLLLAASVTTACDNRLPGAEADHPTSRTASTPSVTPDICWGRNVAPAVVETVTEQTELKPNETHGDGAAPQPTVYKTETRQVIVQERVETRFEIPCAGTMTPEFVASFQRALTARGYYRGPITGQMNARTRAALRSYQSRQGLNSDILSMETARLLGLVAAKRPE